MSATIKDVANKCGLPAHLVGRVLNDYASIGPEAQKKVLEAAREVGYPLEKAEKPQLTHNLGVLFVDETYSGLTHPFFATMLNAFKSEVESRGYDITFINHNIGTMDMTYLEHCRYRNVDGVCLACVDFYSSEVAELVNSDLPCVTIDHTFDNRCSIISDNVNGIRMLVDRAVALGHRRIAYIHGQKRNSAVTENRVQGFCRAMEMNGLDLPDGYVVPGRYDDFEHIRESLVALLDRADRPTCILLPDDASYFGALDTIREKGLRVPEDISVAGYDGVRSVQAVHPRLTTIRQDSDALGRQAALQLIGQIDHSNAAAGASILIPTTLIEGESLGIAPGDRSQA